MLKLFLPSEHVKNIFEITPSILKERGIKGIITDLDNTLVEWDRPSATPMLIKWFEVMIENGIRIVALAPGQSLRVECKAILVGSLRQVNCRVLGRNIQNGLP